MCLDETDQQRSVSSDSFVLPDAFCCVLISRPGACNQKANRALSMAKQALDPQKWVTCVGCAKIFTKRRYIRGMSVHCKASKSCARAAALIYNNPMHPQRNLVVGRNGYLLGEKN